MITIYYTKNDSNPQIKVANRVYAKFDEPALRSWGNRTP